MIMVVEETEEQDDDDEECDDDDDVVEGVEIRGDSVVMFISFLPFFFCISGVDCVEDTMSLDDD